MGLNLLIYWGKFLHQLLIQGIFLIDFGLELKYFLMIILRKVIDHLDSLIHESVVAITSADVEVVDLLIQKGFDVDVRFDGVGSRLDTLLMYVLILRDLRN